MPLFVRSLMCSALLLLLAPVVVQARAQAPVTFARWSAPALAPVDPHAPLGASVPDSVRSRVGYQHWKGAAIGGATGGVVLLLLALAANGSCADCGADGTDWVLQSALLGVSGGGALGFLIGLASPRHARVPATPAP